MTCAVATMLMFGDWQEDEPLDEVAASQHPQQLSDILDTLVRDCVCPSNKLDVPCRPPRTSTQAVPSTSLAVSKSFSPVTLFHWAFPQRLPDRLLELRVDFALPVLAEVDVRNRRVAYHPQSDRGERNTAPFTGDVRGRRRT